MELLILTDDEQNTVMTYIGQHELRSLVLQNDAGTIRAQARDQSTTLLEGTGSNLTDALTDLASKF